MNLLDEHRGEGALVMVTHDPSMLARADRIVRIVDGRLIREGEDDGPVKKLGTYGVPGR